MTRRKVMEFTRDNGSIRERTWGAVRTGRRLYFPLAQVVRFSERQTAAHTIRVTHAASGNRPDRRNPQRSAPKTWRYLLDHAKQLDKRGSSIYAKRARFSVFGVGDYSFSPAKVAISGLYKNLQFQAVGSSGGKPIMVDDTCNFIPCDSMSEAEFFADLLNSEPAQRFISALVFPDAKRPVTIDVLSNELTSRS